MNLERWCCSIYLLTVIALPVQSFQIPLLRRFLPFSSDDLNTRLWDDKQDYWSRYFMVNEAPFLSSNFVTEYIKRNTNHWSRSFNFPDRLYIDFNSRSQQASRSCSIWSNLFLSSLLSANNRYIMNIFPRQLDFTVPTILMKIFVYHHKRCGTHIDICRAVMFSGSVLLCYSISYS